MKRACLLLGKMGLLFFIASVLFAGQPVEKMSSSSDVPPVISSKEEGTSSEEEEEVSSQDIPSLVPWTSESSVYGSSEEGVSGTETSDSFTEESENGSSSALPLPGRAESGKDHTSSGESSSFQRQEDTVISPEAGSETAGAKQKASPFGMLQWLHRLFQSWSVNKALSWLISSLLTLLVLFVLSVGASFVLDRWVFRSLMHRLLGRTVKPFFRQLWGSKVFHWVSWLLPGMVLLSSADRIPLFTSWLAPLATIYLDVMVAFVMMAFLDMIEAIYEEHDLARRRPLKGIFQVIKVIVYVLMGILIISQILGQDPKFWVGSLGALSAVAGFVFKDPILGLYAGAQISANDLVHIGDWLEIPKEEVSGTVVDIALTTIKLLSSSRSIVTIPTYSLVSQPFVNFREMKNENVRRIKKSIRIDAYSVSFLTEEALRSFKKDPYIGSALQKYVGVKADQLTNLGLFRRSIGEILRQSPSIRNKAGSPILVHQLESVGRGIPIEVIAFYNSYDWEKYENFQSDLFDTFYALVPRFGLKLFQEGSFSQEE